MGNAYGAHAYECIASLSAGMVLMFFGLFDYVGGGSDVMSIGTVAAGIGIECLGFFFAYLGYRDSLRQSRLSKS
jgi:hypothetical protein